MGLDMYLYGQRNLPADFDLAATERAEFERDTSVYLSGYEFSPPEERDRYRELVALAGLAAYADPDTPSCSIVGAGDGFALRATVGYWRKANQIHSWFVRECQGDVDECQLTEVSREQLTELRDRVRRVLDASTLVEGLVKNGQTFKPEWGEWRTNLEQGKIIVNPEVAETELPTQAGFFFGSTDYDEGYIRDLGETLEIIDRALALPADATIYYASSW